MLFVSTVWTEILTVTVKALKAAQVVAVPTDTIYGLACVAQSSAAVRRVYDIKGRNGDKPLAICVGEIQDIYRFVPSSDQFTETTLLLKGLGSVRYLFVIIIS